MSIYPMYEQSLNNYQTVARIKQQIVEEVLKEVAQNPTCYRHKVYTVARRTFLQFQQQLYDQTFQGSDFDLKAVIQAESIFFNTNLVKNLEAIIQEKRQN